MSHSIALPPLSIARALGPGARGDEVRLLQEWLCLRLGNPYPANLWAYPPVIHCDGDYGPATEAAVRRYQTALGWPVDGVCSPVLFEQLTAPMRGALIGLVPRATLGETVVAVANAHLKAQPREVEENNEGPWVRLYTGGLQGN